MDKEKEIKKRLSKIRLLKELFQSAIALLDRYIEKAEFVLSKDLPLEKSEIHTKYSCEILDDLDAIISKYEG